MTLRTVHAYSGCFPLDLDAPPGRCPVVGCTRTSKRSHSLCPMHLSRHERRTNPVAAQYRRLKAKAKQRRKPFDLTADEWRELCGLTGYQTRTAGQTGDWRRSLTIDRKDPRRGYCIDNIRVITYSRNSSKGQQDKILLRSGRSVALLRVEGEDSPPAAETLEEALERL